MAFPNRKIVVESITKLTNISSPVTLTSTVNIPNQDAVVVVASIIGSLSSIPVANVNVNGTAIPIVSSANDASNNAISISFMRNPPVGNYPVTVNYTNTPSGAQFFVLVLSGVNKRLATPIGFSNVTASSAAPFVTPFQAAAANSFVLDFIYNDNGTAITPNSNQIQFSNSTGTIGTTWAASYQAVPNGPGSTSWNAGAANSDMDVGIILEPANAPSIWFPETSLRNDLDVAAVKGLNVGAATADGTFGYFPSSFYQNSFLHTVGRLLHPAIPVVAVAPAMSTLQDAFHATTLDTNKWTLFIAGGADYTTNPQGAGTVYPATTSGTTDGDISSNLLYDLTGSYAFIRIVQPLSLNASSSDTNFAVRIDQNNTIRFQIEGGTMFAEQIVAGAQTNFKNVPYSTVMHNWLRIREQSGRVYWETSQDGFNWSWFWDAPNPFNVTALRLILAGVSFGVDTSPGSFLYDNLNTLPTGIFDQFTFQPKQPPYASEFWYSVGRLTQPNTTTPPTLVAETELQTSQTVIDRLTQQAVVSGTSVTSDHLVSSQDTVMLIFASQMGVAQALNAVTLNGVALTPLGNPSVSTLTAGAYYVVNPNVGINVISASATLPTALELIVMTLIGVDKKTTTPVIVANTGALGSPSSTITPASANALLIDYVSSLGTSISENASQTVYFDQPQAASQAAGSIKLSTAGLQTMSWTTLSSAWVQLVVALEPANALSMWFPAIDLRNLSDVIPVNNDDASNPVGAFYGTDGNFPTQYWQNSFLHTIGRLPTANTTPAPVATSGGTLMLMGIG